MLYRSVPPQFEVPGDQPMVSVHVEAKLFVTLVTPAKLGADRQNPALASFEFKDGQATPSLEATA
jgi:hypothetical protein